MLLSKEKKIGEKILSITKWYNEQDEVHVESIYWVLTMVYNTQSHWFSGYG
jgi:hypothetical protein